jgi:ABC-type glycerol-3-phosphate transport system substrate-binding protein
MDVATESFDEMKIDLDAAQELFKQIGFPEPTPEQVAQARELFAAMQSEDDEAGAGGPPGMMAARGNPDEQGDDPEDRAPVDYDSLEAKTVSVALVLGSPDFQQR